jgi:hypothetical protein
MSHAEEDRIEPEHYFKSEVTETKQKWSHDDDKPETQWKIKS